MKKLISLFFVCVFAIASSVCFASCSDGFTVVKSISFQFNDNTITYNSSTSPTAVLSDDYKYITASEFESAPEDRKYYWAQGGQALSKLTKISIKDAISAANGSTYYKVVEDELEGKYYWKYAENSSIYYVELEYEYTYCEFVYVNVKDYPTIVIRSGQSGTETTYTVSGYSITEF